jgi:hypothetical protein
VSGETQQNIISVGWSRRTSLCSRDIGTSCAAPTLLGGEIDRVALAILLTTGIFVGHIHLIDELVIGVVFEHKGRIGDDILHGMARRHEGDRRSENRWSPLF